MRTKICAGRQNCRSSTDPELSSGYITKTKMTENHFFSHFSWFFQNFPDFFDFSRLFPTFQSFLYIQKKFNNSFNNMKLLFFWICTEFLDLFQVSPDFFRFLQIPQLFGIFNMFYFSNFFNSFNFSNFFQFFQFFSVFFIF